MTEIVTNVIRVWDEDVQYFINQWWEIIWYAPNPYPQPYLYFFVSKECEKLSKEDKINLLNLASNDTNS